MADLVRVATGVDLVEVQLRMALGEELPDELVRPRFSQPLAIRFLTAEPGPLPTGPRDADRPARQGARVSRRRAGGRLPPGRRDDPARAARRRPARLRDRDRQTRTSRRSSAPRRLRACSTWRSSERSSDSAGRRRLRHDGRHVGGLVGAGSTSDPRREWLAELIARLPAGGQRARARLWQRDRRDARAGCDASSSPASTCRPSSCGERGAVSPSADFVQADIATVEFEPASFDGVCAVLRRSTISRATCSRALFGRVHDLAQPRRACSLPRSGSATRKAGTASGSACRCSSPASRRRRTRG